MTQQQETLLSLAHSYIDVGQLDLAQKAAERAVDDQSAAYAYLQGRLFYARGEYASAKLSLAQSYERNRFNIDLLITLTATYRALGDSEGVAACLADLEYFAQHDPECLGAAVREAKAELGETGTWASSIGESAERLLADPEDENALSDAEQGVVVAANINPYEHADVVDIDLGDVDLGEYDQTAEDDAIVERDEDEVAVAAADTSVVDDLFQDTALPEVFDSARDIASNGIHLADYLSLDVLSNVLPDVLSHGKTMKMQAGTKFIAKGKPCSKLMYLLSGAVTVSVGAQQFVVQAPGCFGEEFLFEAGNWSIDAVIAENAEIVIFPLSLLAQLIAVEPSRELLLHIAAQSEAKLGLCAPLLGELSMSVPPAEAWDQETIDELALAARQQVDAYAFALQALSA